MGTDAASPHQHVQFEQRWDASAGRYQSLIVSEWPRSTTMSDEFVALENEFISHSDESIGHVLTIRLANGWARYLLQEHIAMDMGGGAWHAILQSYEGPDAR